MCLKPFCYVFATAPILLSLSHKTSARERIDSTLIFQRILFPFYEFLATDTNTVFILIKIELFQLLNMQNDQIPNKT